MSSAEQKSRLKFEPALRQYTGCIARALTRQEFIEQLQTAGLSDV